MIVAFTGKAGAGKNTAASMVNFIVNNKRFTDWEYAKDLDFKEAYTASIIFEEKSFAAKLKDIAAILTGLPRANFDDRTLRNEPLPCPGLYDPMVIVQNSFKGVTFANLHNYTYRTFLQRLGTEAMRWGLHQDIWVNALISEYLPLDPEKRRSVGNVLDYSDCTWPDWIITDLRFNNEAEAVHRSQGKIIEITKLDSKNDTHESEGGINYNYINYTIQNDGSYEELFNKLQQLKNFLL